VLHDGKEIRACITPVAAVGKGAVTTLEGLPALWKAKARTTAKTDDLHPSSRPGSRSRYRSAATARTG
jgi:isoquinoline 1-oxidoreductase alpha subunit